MSKKKIKVAIVGVGNCAKSLVQGVDYYANNQTNQDGLTRKDIGGYESTDITFVAAFDVDDRKVGRLLDEAIYQGTNNAWDITGDYVKRYYPCRVTEAPLLDGVASHMRTSDVTDKTKFYLDQNKLTPVAELDANVDKVLKDTKPDIIINYLPVGSEDATKYWANKCIKHGIAFMNCIPVFIASDPTWEQKFIDAGIPLIGDDMKSQFGASIVSQMLQELAFARGHKVKCHIQRNVGGNTDFHNMEDKSRLKSKKISKENVIRSQNDIHGVDPKDSFLHAGPSEYIEHYGDNKIANFHLELKGFGGAPVILDAQLSVQDSPNSAGVVIDGIRYLQVAKELGIVGALHGASAFTQKTPPTQMTLDEAITECDELANRKFTKLTTGNRFINAPEEI